MKLYFSWDSCNTIQLRHAIHNKIHCLCLIVFILKRICWVHNSSNFHINCLLTLIHLHVDTESISIPDFIDFHQDPNRIANPQELLQFVPSVPHFKEQIHLLVNPHSFPLGFLKARTLMERVRGNFLKAGGIQGGRREGGWGGVRGSERGVRGVRGR